MQPFDEVRGRIAEQEIDDADGQIHLDQPAVALGDLGRRTEQVGGRYDINEGRILKQDDRLRQQNGQDVQERLRKKNVNLGLEF